MNKIYSRIMWENRPSIKTPINEQNLNSMDAAIYDLDDRIILVDSTKLSIVDSAHDIVDWILDENTGIITITKRNGEVSEYDLNIEKIPVSFSMSEDGLITLTTEDGTEFTANISDVIPIINFSDSDTISVQKTTDGKENTYKLEIKDFSVTERKLQPNFLSEIKLNAEKAQLSEQSAAEQASKAEKQAKISESWAVGQTGERDGENFDNSKYYSEVSREQANIAKEAIKTIDDKIQVVKFDVDDAGYLTYDDAVPYLFSVDNNGNLTWEVE